MESKKPKKPTKKQMQENVVNYVNNTLHENYLRAFVQGFEVANNMILEYCNNHTVEEIAEFCKKNIKKKDVLEKVVNSKKNG